MMKSEIALDWGLTQLGEKGDKWTSSFLSYRGPLTKLRASFFFFVGGVGVYRRAKRPVITINSNQIFLF